MSFDRCPSCKEFGWRDTHACAPRWECSQYADGDDGEDWHVHYAHDAKEAAEKFVDEHESSEGEVRVGAGFGCMEVFVREAGKEETPALYVVSGEARAHYYADLKA